MKLRRDAKLSVKGRELLVERVPGAGWSLTQAAEAVGVSHRTAPQVALALPDRKYRRAAGSLLSA